MASTSRKRNDIGRQSASQNLPPPKKRITHSGAATNAIDGRSNLSFAVETFRSPAKNLIRK